MIQISRFPLCVSTLFMLASCGQDSGSNILEGGSPQSEASSNSEGNENNENGGESSGQGNESNEGDTSSPSENGGDQETGEDNEENGNDILYDVGGGEGNESNSGGDACGVDHTPCDANTSDFFQRSKICQWFFLCR